MANEIYDSITTIITAGGYDLDDVLHRIDVLYAAGKLNDDERTQAQQLARDNAKAEYSYAPIEKRVEAIETWMVNVDARLSALESDGGEQTGGSETGTDDEWPEYVQPTGAHDAYHVGDKITYNGKHYTCQIDNCVWTPDAYPQGWELLE